MMVEYIEREAVIRKIRMEQSSHQTLRERMSVNEAVVVIGEMPAADVQEVRHGSWIPISDGDGAECSECGEYYDCDEHFDLFKQLYHYCPHCGAKMDRRDKQ